MTVDYAAPALTMLSEEEQDFRRMARATSKSLSDCNRRTK